MGVGMVEMEGTGRKVEVRVCLFGIRPSFARHQCKMQNEKMKNRGRGEGKEEVGSQRAEVREEGPRRRDSAAGGLFLAPFSEGFG